MRNYANTAIYRDGDGVLTVRLHDTAIVRISESDAAPECNKITFDHGGWKTPTTKRRINQASTLVIGGYGWHVSQRRGEWVVKRSNGEVHHWSGQTLELPLDPYGCGCREYFDDPYCHQHYDGGWEIVANKSL